MPTRVGMGRHCFCSEEDSMEYFLNQLVNGLCQGSMYALMAIGYSVVVGVVGMVTFTHGEVIMIGA